jgi:hypothetical protein
MHGSRQIVVVVIALLLISEIASQMNDVFGEGAGFFGGLFVAVVQWYFARKAKAHVRYYFYLVIPTLMFTIIPIGIRIWNFVHGEEMGILQKFWKFGPTFISFLLPIILLLYVYWDLRPREKPSIAEKTASEAPNGRKT